MIKKRKQYKIKYLYHYTKKDNVNMILKDGKIKSRDQYVFFTGSLKDSVNVFKKEMMSYKYYIDVDLKLKQRQAVSKEDYVILKIPYIEDDKFYMFDFNNSDSIYDKSIVHDGSYNFDKVEVIDFPKERIFSFNPLLVKLLISFSLLVPCPVLADSWVDSPNYNISWYDESLTSYDINNAQDLAGLAYLVNVNNVSFENKIVNLNSDMSLIDHDWEEIGNIFSGTIDGAHRILLNGNNSKLFASNNNYQLSLAYYYPAKLISDNGVSNDIYLTSDDTIDDFKNKLINDGLFSSNDIIVYNGNILDTGTIKDSNILENGKLYVYEGFVFFKLDSGEYFGISCESDNSIEEIKDLIKTKKGFAKERMKIYENNVELDETKSLADYNIQRKSVLLLKLNDEIINPKTYDSIILYVIIGTLSLLGSVLILVNKFRIIVVKDV